VITLLSSRHAGEVFKHLRHAHALTRPRLARLLHVSPRTIEDRETFRNGIPTDGLIDTAAVFGFAVALVPQRHPGARPTGTGWPT
jgi:transcriptional regulator with XRE-family HTH domain